MATNPTAKKRSKHEVLSARDAEHIGNVVTLTEREGTIPMDKGLILQQRLEDIGFYIVRMPK